MNFCLSSGHGLISYTCCFHRDAEVRLWTDMFMIPASGEDNPPQPGMSFLELDFNKNVVDVLVLKKYLSERSLNGNEALLIAPAAYVSAPDSGFEKLISRIGSDNRAIDASALNQELHMNVPLLLESESVVMAFRTGRDIVIFTNLRIVELDVQGWSGAKVSYTSIPYNKIRAFSAESAGGLDRDSEVDIYTRNLWDLGKYELDFRKGKAGERRCLKSTKCRFSRVCCRHYSDTKVLDWNDSWKGGRQENVPN